MYVMQFEWNDQKNRTNEAKHNIDFNSAKELWNDPGRVEVLAAYPLESRSILIGKIGQKLWAAIFTRRNSTIRIISVRRARTKEAELYGKKENS